MGKKNKRKGRSPVQEDNSDAMLAMLIGEEEDSTDSLSRGNYFQDLAESSGNEEERLEEEKNPIDYGYLEKKPGKRQVSKEFPPLEAHQIASDPRVHSPKDQLMQKIACYQSALEEKGSKLKAALQEKDKLIEKSRNVDVLQSKLVNALVKVEELEEKLTRRKEKYREKLEAADRFLGERDQLKKAELFSQHLQAECKEKLAQMDPIFKQNKDLVEANRRLKQELSCLNELMEATQVSRDKAVSALKGKLAAANNALSAATKEKSTELAAASREIEAVKRALRAAEDREAALSQQIGRFQVSTYENVSLEDCHQLLSSHLEAACSLQRAIQRKSETEKCVVCLEKERKVLLLPCAHLMLCVECARKLTFCPICRTGIATKVNVRD